ncbi:putative metal homeostasis protein [Erysipelothrix inopinata]|uniref:Putative metal homeostasis protein n=1 Tax=Erysipelothrix inopinata TaxID=225084 RepID=A0A7G9S1L8_9FIRM|nr:putative metal homeostasis protein [Erysipelothrix inopinata]QNN61743.1 putative metal homeostasis protein [Erysipelothrix inopinata]
MIKDVNAAYRYVNSRNKKTRRKALAMIREHNRLKEKK